MVRRGCFLRKIRKRYTPRCSIASAKAAGKSCSNTTPRRKLGTTTAYPTEHACSTMRIYLKNPSENQIFMRDLLSRSARKQKQKKILQQKIPWGFSCSKFFHENVEVGKF